MKKFNCPSCGAEVLFQSNVSVSTVCDYCNSLIVRHDLDVEAIGIMATLPDDMSPLQLGAEGRYQNKGFHLIGRLKIGWKDGVWNEWHVLMDDGSRGWIAEAQGAYAICFEYDQPLSAETIKAINSCLKTSHPLDTSINSDEAWQNSLRQEMAGKYLFINQLKYRIVDVKPSICIGCEGELPFVSPAGRKTLTIDLLGFHGEFASIELAKEKTRVYLGHYMEWHQFQFENLRQLEEW